MVYHPGAGSALLGLVTKVIEAGASEMEVEYKDGCEEVFAIGAGMSVCIARLDSSSTEACSLREALYAIAD